MFEKEIAELRQKLKTLEAAAAQQAHKSMVFTPEAGERFGYVTFGRQGHGWLIFRTTRLTSDNGDYSTPALREDYAKGETEVLNAIYKARACKGVVLSPDMKDGDRYWYIDAYAHPNCWGQDCDYTWLEQYLFPAFETKEDCQACIDMLGGSEAVKRLMRLWHGAVA